MSPITVAVVGATGNIGTPLCELLLSKEYYPERVSRVIFFTRDASADKAAALVKLRAEAVECTGDTVTTDHLKGVDVLINCASLLAGEQHAEAFAKAAAETGVKLYIPPGYGPDGRPSKIKHAVFDGRVNHVNRARELGGGRMKVVPIMCGLFMRYMFWAPFGLDVPNNTFTLWCEAGVKISTIGVKDLVHSIAQIAVHDPKSLPDDGLRIQGDCNSYQEMANTLTNESGDEIKIIPGDYDAIKKSIDDKKDGDVGAYVRLLYAEGTVDYTVQNDNEVVNPGESIWKWSTISDFAKATKGKPTMELGAQIGV